MVLISGMLEMELLMASSLAKCTSKVAFIAGSSKQGKARRASIGSNCVTAKYLKGRGESFVGGLDGGYSGGCGRSCS